MRQKLLGLSGWVVAGVVLLAGAGDRGEVRCRRLVIEDENGKPRVLATSDEGDASVVVYDTQGDERISLTVDNKSVPLVNLWGRDGKPRVTLGVNGLGDPVVWTFGRDGKRHKVVAP